MPHVALCQNIRCVRFTVLVAQVASPEDAEPVSSSSWTAVAMMGTLRHKHTHASLFWHKIHSQTELQNVSQLCDDSDLCNFHIIVFILFTPYVCLNSASLTFFTKSPKLLRFVTDRWFSLLGPKESLMSLCKWMAR